MTEPDKKLPEEKKDVADKKAAKPKPKNRTSSNAGVYTLLIIVVIASAGGFYAVWEKLQQTQRSQRVATQRLDQNIESITTQQADSSASTEKQLEALKAAQENLRHNLTNLIENKKHLRNDWLMAEAEYLVKLANQRLLLVKDVPTALAALKAADARLAEVADPALLNIRKILAGDIQKLKNIPGIDVAGLSITLSTLANNIPNLPLRTPDPKTHKLDEAGKTTATHQVKSIKDLPSAIWQDIKSLIVIRHHQQPVEPLLSPEQHFFLVQNLALLLEQARLALLNGQNEIYQDRLNATAKWVSQFFDPEHNVTRNMLATIKELQKYDIDPALPDISGTFSALQKYRLQGLQPEESRVKAEEK